MQRALLALAVLGVLRAQDMKNDTFHLDNGAVVLYQTYSQVELSDRVRMFGTASASGNTIQRTMTDGTHRTWLGFGLRIERLPGDPIRFRISMNPLNEWGFFGQRAPSRDLQNGDRVLLDVLEEPGTGRKIYDTFQVGIGVEMQMMPMAKSIPQVPAAGAAIRLQNPNLLTGGASVGRSNSSVQGSEVSLISPGKVRFRFSSQPQPGYRMEAIAEGNRLMFVAGNAVYTAECSGPIMEGAGAWYVWVHHEPAGDAPAGARAAELPLQE
jgi:hypothetical protein